MEVRAEYKNSEVGTIPKDWEVKKLGDITLIKRGKFTPRPRNNPIYYGGNIPFVQTGDVTKSNGKIIDFAQTLNAEGLAVSTLFKKGTILMTIAANIGYSGILQIDMACPDSLVAIDGLGKTDNEFLNYYFSFKREKLEELATTGAQMNLNIERLCPFQIPLPPTKAEQTAIATALSDADALTTSLEKLIAKKRNIKQGAMQMLLKPKKGWEVKKLGDYIRFQTGFPFSSEHFTIDPSGIRLIKNRDLRSDDSIVYYSGEYSKNFCVYNGDLLIGMDGDFEPVLWEKGVALLNQRVGRVIKIKEISIQFLSFTILKVLKDIELRTSATTVKHLSHSDIERIEMYIPPYEEQTRIATILSDMNADIGSLEIKLEKYRKVKLGMMQNLLTGKIRLV